MIVALVQFQRSFSYRPMQHIEDFIREFENESSFIEVQTSGSTGVPKRMLVEKSRMINSAKRTLSVLGLQPGSVALICLPTQYIAGKMMIVRALVGGMRIESVSPQANPLLGFDESRLSEQTLLAITPHQLTEILNNEESRRVLEKLSHVIVGGGAIPESVEQIAMSLPESVKVFATYGMTETLSHVALRRINGIQRQLEFTPLYGVSLSTDAENCLILTDELTSPHPLITNDIVEILPNGNFRVLGRRDNVIISGGVKLQIEAIENQLSDSLPVKLLLTYVNDAHFGQALTMLYEGEVSVEALRQSCVNVVSRYEVPKHFFQVDQLPLTETGKPARGKAHELAESLLQII